VLIDAGGQTLSTDDPAARAAWDATQTGFLAHAAATPAHLSATLAADPAFALAHVAAGFFQLLLGRRETTEAARQALARADAAQADTLRERAYREALRLALSGRLFAAAEALEAIAREHPLDAFAGTVSIMGVTRRWPAAC
jgi:TolA-binding protein